jgi:hypothetical protein
VGGGQIQASRIRSLSGLSAPREFACTIVAEKLTEQRPGEDEMETKQPLPGSGRFHWKMGGWLGGQLGGTAWMFVGAVVLVRHAPEVAGVWLVCFSVANAIGFCMWRRRDRLRPYPALQALLLACGVNSLMALIALHVLRPGLRIARPIGIYLADKPQQIPWFLVLVVSLMTYFHLMEWGAKQERSRSEGQTSR